MSFHAKLSSTLERGPAAALLVFLLALLVYAPTVAKDSVSTDTAVSSWTAWRLAHTGEPWMEGLNLREDDLPIGYFQETPQGHTVTSRSPGPIWAAVPFYLGSSDDLEEIDYWRSGLAVASLTAGAMAFVFLTLRQSLGNRVAGGVTAIVALATPMWSVSADALWTHSVTTFGIAGAAWAASRDRWWSAGVLLGIGILGRPHVALIALALGLGMAWARRSPTIALRVGLSSALGFVPLLLWNRSVFGVWGISSGYGHTVESVVPGLQGATDGGIPGLLLAMSAYLTNTAGFLLSPDRGLLVWTPILLLLLPSVVRAWGGLPAWARWLAAGGLLYSAIQLEMNGFSGGDAFYGYRLGLELLICVVPAYALSLRYAGGFVRLVAPTVVGLQLSAMSLGSILDGLFLRDEQAWRDNSFLHVLTEAPLVVGLWTGLVTVLAVVLIRQLTDGQKLSRDEILALATADGDKAPCKQSIP